MDIFILLLAMVTAASAQVPVTLQQVEDAQRTGKYVCECKYIGAPIYNPALNPGFRKTNLGTCVTGSKCDADLDCGAGAGNCNGLKAGTCNCAACINFKKCNEDSDCGGLIGGCNIQSGQCHCQRAMERLGFETILEQNQKLCGVRTCSLGCFGLPCNQGICTCPLH